MKKLIFKDKEYVEIEVNSESPEGIDINSEQLNLKAGKCLWNSYIISKSRNNIDMVEGFLITYFKDESIESVGHVWNVFNEIHFDLTLNLLDHNQLIKKHQYFISKIYHVDDISTDNILKQGKTMYDMFNEDNYEKRLTFKTEVQKLEKELSLFLNQKNKKE